MGIPNPPIEALIKEVESAAANYAGAKQREEIARNEATKALNSLNRAQKALDNRVMDMKQSAPLGSDWARSTRG